MRFRAQREILEIAPLARFLKNLLNCTTAERQAFGPGQDGEAVEAEGFSARGGLVETNHGEVRKLSYSKRKHSSKAIYKPHHKCAFSPIVAESTKTLPEIHLLDGVGALASAQGSDSFRFAYFVLRAHFFDFHFVFKVVELDEKFTSAQRV